MVSALGDPAPASQENTVEGLRIDPNNLVCPSPGCDKEYNQLTWLEKHIKDKHPSGSTTSDMSSPGGTSFQSVADLESYVSSVVSLGGVEEPSIEGMAELEEPETIDFELGIEEAQIMVEMFHTFIDNLIGLLLDLDFEYYGAMPKKQQKAVARTISRYLKASNYRVTPGTFLFLNLTMIYGGMTVKLPKVIREKRRERDEQRKIAGETET